MGCVKFNRMFDDRNWEAPYYIPVIADGTFPQVHGNASEAVPFFSAELLAELRNNTDSLTQHPPA